MPLAIFKIPNLSPGNLVMALLAAAWIPLWFFLNLYLQQTLNYSAFNSGACITAHDYCYYVFDGRCYREAGS
jgi:hypothetical protein